MIAHAAVLFAIGAASAAEPTTIEIPAGGFLIDRGSAELSIHQISVPPVVAILNSARLCRVSVGWQDGKWVATRREGCHPNVVDSVDKAAASWSIEVTHPPDHDQELFEYWYVYPDVAGGKVEVMLRQAFDQRVTLESSDVGVLDYVVRGRLFPEYPPAALKMDTTLTRCTARIDVEPTGIPKEVQVDGCDPVFRPDLLDNLSSWRFEGPKLDGVPFLSAVTLGFQFDKPVDPDGDGTVKVLLPPALVGAAVAQLHQDTPPPDDPPPPMPDWDPVMVLNHKSFAEVRVYDVRWPENLPRLDHDATCTVLFQVNSVRRVWAWAEDCDEAVRPAVEIAANRWLLAPGHRDPGERYARFRGTFVLPADGSHPWLRVPIADLVATDKPLPEYVRTFREASLLVAVPPKLPRNFATEVLETRVECEYDVTVDPRGHPGAADKKFCPGNLADYAEKALQKWRWVPAEADGKPVDTRVAVKIRFDLGVKAASASKPPPG